MLWIGIAAIALAVCACIAFVLVNHYSYKPVIDVLEAKDSEHEEVTIFINIENEQSRTFSGLVVELEFAVKTSDGHELHPLIKRNMPTIGAGEKLLNKPVTLSYEELGVKGKKITSLKLVSYKYY